MHNACSNFLHFSCTWIRLSMRYTFTFDLVLFMSLILATLCAASLVLQPMFLFIHPVVRSFNRMFFKSHSFSPFLRDLHQPPTGLLPVFARLLCATHIDTESDFISLSVLKSKRYFVCCARIQLILNDFISLCYYFHCNLNSIQALIPIPYSSHLHVYCNWIVSTSYIRHIL